MSTEQQGLPGNLNHFHINDETERSNEYRKVLWTGEHMQIVTMSIPPGEEIGEEVHEHGDQILTFVSGMGEAILEGETHPVEAGDQCAVPAGALHNFRNTGDEPLKLWTVYAPPEHAADAAFDTKEEADAAEEAGEDEPPS